MATRRAFSTRMTKASRADVQKLVLLMAVAAYAFWVIKAGGERQEEDQKEEQEERVRRSRRRSKRKKKKIE